MNWIEQAIKNGGELRVGTSGALVIGGEDISTCKFLATMRWEGVEEMVAVTAMTFAEVIEKMESALREDAAAEMARNPRSGV